MSTKKTTFKIVGVFCSEQYQKCKYYAGTLYSQFRDKFNAPIYRPMLDVQWHKYLQKWRRIDGGRLWCVSVPVAVFKNGVYFGDDEDLLEYACRNFDYYFFGLDFERFGELHLCKYLQDSERAHVFFSVCIDGRLVETFVIQLYTDLVPLTCANFLRMCDLHDGGYKYCKISRIVKNCWIQFGCEKMASDRIPCENYCVPHDQRGVVSMCNDGKHRDNSTQFVISLEPTPWMDYYYVAFGQVVHGEDVLQHIEEVPTKYEIPLNPIVVRDCGEFSFKKKCDDIPKYDYNSQSELSKHFSTNSFM